MKSRRCGSVASPTPTMPISSDSTSSDVGLSRQQFGERGGGHPAGGAAAEDDDTDGIGCVQGAVSARAACGPITAPVNSPAPMVARIEASTPVANGRHAAAPAGRHDRSALCAGDAELQVDGHHGLIVQCQHASPRARRRLVCARAASQDDGIAIRQPFAAKEQEMILVGQRQQPGAVADFVGLKATRVSITAS